MLFVRGRVVRRRKTSWFLRRRSLTPWWAAEWSGGIIPCIIQEWKLTLSRDTPSIKGGCHNRVPAEGTQEWRGSETEGGILLVTAGVAGGLSDGVKWRAIPKSLLELATHYFNRWPWNHVWHVDRLRQRRCRTNTVWAWVGAKQEDEDLRFKGIYTLERYFTVWDMCT